MLAAKLVKKENIIFRNEITDISRTTYGAFSIYKYPAKFIPQVIMYIFKNYLSSSDKVFDPFGGSGTVGLVSRLYGNQYELWDLNPMIDIIHKTALIENNNFDISKIINDIKYSTKNFLPQWSNLNYWVPEEFQETISKTWGFLQNLDDDLKYTITIPLLKTTRFFSTSDEKTHKLYKSKFAIKKIENLLNSDWKTYFYHKIELYVSYLKAICSLSKLSSDSDIPYLYYRMAENLFCKAFDAQNLSREDLAYDAKFQNFGIGIKTFQSKGNKLEKVAEFNKDSEELRKLSGFELIEKISILRNERISFAKRTYGINSLIYMFQVVRYYLLKFVKITVKH